MKIRQFKYYQKEQKEKEHTIFTNLGRVGSLWFNIATKIKFRYYIIIRMRERQEKGP